jgi:hypothetical protein
LCSKLGIETELRSNAVIPVCALQVKRSLWSLQDFDTLKVPRKENAGEVLITNLVLLDHIFVVKFLFVFFFLILDTKYFKFINLGFFCILLLAKEKKNNNSSNFIYVFSFMSRAQGKKSLHLYLHQIKIFFLYL